MAETENKPIISTCRTCGAQIAQGMHNNKFYCDKCAELWNKYGAYRYKIAKGVYVWVKGRLFRAVVDGKDVSPIREQKEIGEWSE